MRGDNQQRLLYYLKSCKVIVLFFMLSTACSKRSNLQEARGDVQVQVGVQASADSYALKTVSLIGIDNLKEVAGKFVHFFYAPGAKDDQLTGTAPHANFILSGSVFIPSDVISMQMATIYYHMQNLANFDDQVGAAGVNQWPRAVGIETQISDNTAMKRNNAFYNGQTDSMMFVPFNGSDLPITMNAGIIAHEHFHSLFYKIVIKPAIKAKKIFVNAASIHADNSMSYVDSLATAENPKVISDKERATIFNETYLRGINEGIADFWGWLYTDDQEFMRWSLPKFQADRTLALSESNVGFFENDQDINEKIDEMVQVADNPQTALMNYSYKIGTPHARFLKQLTLLHAENKKIDLALAKLQMAQIIFEYIKTLSSDVSLLGENQMINSASLFDYISNISQNKNFQFELNQSECEFIVQYINHIKISDKSEAKCQNKDNHLIIIKKP